TRLLLTATGRRERGAFLAEGVKLVRDALAAGAQPRQVWIAPALLSRRPDAGALMEQLADWPVVEADGHVLASLADTETPQGVVAVFPMPGRTAVGDLGQLLLVLDGIQDPGNLGTILRSALGSGVVATV